MVYVKSGNLVNMKSWSIVKTAGDDRATIHRRPHHSCFRCSSRNSDFQLSLFQQRHISASLTASLADNFNILCRLMMDRCGH